MPSKRKLTVLALSVLGLAALASFGYYANRLVAAPQPAAPGAAAGQASPGGGPPGGFAVAVETAKVEKGTLQQDITAVGSLRSNESVVMRPEIAGRIERINFRDGARVERGAVLVALDASTQEAELRQARANLALSQANYKRTEELFQKKFVSGRAQDEAGANLKVLEAAVALAEAKLRKTQIRAPFTGIVGIRNVSVGDYVKEGQDLINLEDISTLKADFKLPEAFLGQLRPGQSVQLGTDALPDESFKATVDAIDPLLDAAGRAVSLRARLENPAGRLRPGMFVRVRLILAERADALTVPEEALIPQGNEQFVYRIAEGKAQYVKVKTGLRRGGRVEITEGLTLADVVVSAGQLKLRDGAPVRIVQPGSPAAGPQQAAAPGPTEKH